MTEEQFFNMYPNFRDAKPIPAFCDNCGLIFKGPITGVDIVVDIKNTIVQCPNCGHDGYIHDGVYSIINNTIEIIRASQPTKKKINTYKKTFEELRDGNASLEDIEKEINKSAPELNGIVSFLPKTRKELYAFITLILFIIATFHNCVDDKEINATTIINNYNNINVKQESHDKSEIKISKPKIGRNDPCPCNSGKKFKKCHGDPNNNN